METSTLYALVSEGSQVWSSRTIRIAASVGIPWLYTRYTKWFDLEKLSCSRSDLWLPIDVQIYGRPTYRIINVLTQQGRRSNSMKLDPIGITLDSDMCTSFKQDVSIRCNKILQSLHLLLQYFYDKLFWTITSIFLSFQA